jgi:hypothetical protein
MRKMGMALAAAAMMLAGAGTWAEGGRIVGFGSRSCGYWTQVRTSPGASRAGPETWVAGFVSGMNQDPTHLDALDETDYDGLMAWIDNDCKAYPLQQIADAAYRLVNELRARALLRKK